MKKRKKGRPPSENPMVHTAVVLPRDLLGRLKRDAEAFGRGLSTEIRQRLQLTYDWQGLPRDLETSDLVEAIKTLADNLAGDLGKKWNQHPYAWAAFSAGVAQFLAQYQSEGDASVRPDTRVVGNPDDPPDVVGRTHARLIIATNALRGTKRELPNGKED
jgi:hypothetical protein